MLPELKDTELRVLLVVLRLTTGMNREGRPVVIPYRTLKRLTGRQSEAIAGALRSLANSGLIHITGFRRATRAEEAKRTGQQTEQQQ